MNIQVPTIHLNGTSKRVLLEELGAADESVRDAFEKLAHAAPNARDYYVADDPEAFTKAKREHVARLNKIREIVEELEFLQIEIHTQN